MIRPMTNMRSLWRALMSKLLNTLSMLVGVPAMLLNDLSDWLWEKSGERAKFLARNRAIVAAMDIDRAAFEREWDRARHDPAWIKSSTT